MQPLWAASHIHLMNHVCALTPRDTFLKATWSHAWQSVISVVYAIKPEQLSLGGWVTQMQHTNPHEL